MGFPNHLINKSSNQLPTMYFIDPHVHMVSRVTDDYERMRRMGCVAVSEPAFWAGFDRGSVDGFRDYFRQLTEFEPKRAGWSGVQHYTWLCINAKEAENVELSRGVIEMIPEFLNKPGVLGIGEIGLNKNTPNECTIFREHLELAAKTNELVLIHTPHLVDKYKGTRMIVDMLQERDDIPPHRVLIDHVEEHTVKVAKEGGFWCAMTLYPTTKCTPARRRHHRTLRRRSDHGQLSRRLGPVQPVCGPRLHPGMPPRPHRGQDPQDRLRKPSNSSASATDSSSRHQSDD
ncbi:MAG: TatD family hydrolase [Planctomycetaceae bacterium]